MTPSHLSVLTWIVLVLTVVRYAIALPFDEPAMPLEPVSRSAAENSRHRGFMWVPRKSKSSYMRGRYEGGYDVAFAAPLGVCRMHHEGGVHPGKVFDGKCNIGYGHTEVIGDEFQLLVAARDAFFHVEFKPETDLAEALTGGREANGHPLKLCVARYRTGWGAFTTYHGYHPGKYVWGKCNFGFADQEISGNDFHLLALGPMLSPKAGAVGIKAARATPIADSGTLRDAASPLGIADAGDAGDASDAGAAAAAGGVERSEAGAVEKSLPQIDCLHGEVTCRCKDITGCTLPGYCPCSS